LQQLAPIHVGDYATRVPSDDIFLPEQAQDSGGVPRIRSSPTGELAHADRGAPIAEGANKTGPYGSFERLDAALWGLGVLACALGLDQQSWAVECDANVAG
jgi:hypothetical protein